MVDLSTLRKTVEALRVHEAETVRLIGHLLDASTKTIWGEAADLLTGAADELLQRREQAARLALVRRILDHTFENRAAQIINVRAAADGTTPIPADLREEYGL